MSGRNRHREDLAAFLLRARSRGFTDGGICAAIEAVPRAEFVPSEFADAAWSSRTVPIPCGESIEGIDHQAFILSCLAIEPGHRILEVGTGSGYTAAVMGRLGAKVKTLERYRTLAEAANSRFHTLGLGGVLARQADGSGGLPAEGPFDRIVVWAAFEQMPRGFADQLASNGVMIAPIGPAEGEQELARLTKIGSRFEKSMIGTVRVQPIASGLPQAL